MKTTTSTLAPVLKGGLVLLGALSISTLSYGFTMTSTVEFSEGGVSVSASDTDSSGTVTASVPGNGFLIPDGAEANQTAIGAGAFGHVFAAGAWAGPSGANFAKAENSFEDTVTVEGDYEFSFFTTVGTLKLFDYAGASPSDPGAPMAELILDIAINGGSVFYSSVKFLGGIGGTALVKSGVDFGGSMVATGDFSIFEYMVDPFATTLDLGTLSVGDTLTYSLVAHTGAAPFELGGLASMGDPGGLNPGSSGLVLKTTPPTHGVPDSPVFGALALALIGMAEVRRRMR